MRLYAERQRQGYRGRRSTGLGDLTQLRKAQGLAPRTRTVQPRPPVPDPSLPCGPPRQATWLVWRQPAHLTAEDQAMLDRLRQAPPAFAQVIALAQGFAQLLRARQPERLDIGWQQAATSPLAALRRLAKSVQRDYAAVKAGVTLPWSTSPVEGHSNRLKTLKRQMFGRARLALRSHRFLRAPRGGQALVPGQRAPSHAPAEAKAAEPHGAPAVGPRSDAWGPAAASKQTRGLCGSGPCRARVGACRVPRVLDLPDVVLIRRARYYSFNYHRNGA
jgi:Transposase